MDSEDTLIETLAETPVENPETPAASGESSFEELPVLAVRDTVIFPGLDGAAEWGVRFHIVMRIPGAVASSGMAELNKPDPLLRQAARQEQLLTEIVRFLFPNTIEISYALRFLGKINDFGRRKLHPRS